MDLKGKKINFLGDSITQGCQTSDEERCRFSTLLTQRCGLAAGRNYGIGGTRIARQREPSESGVWDQDFCGRFGDMADDADIVVVFGGTNDFGHGLAPFGEDGDQTEYTFWGACDYLFRGLKQKYPQARIVVMTPTHRATENSPAGSGNKVNGRLLGEYVEVIRTQAQRWGLDILELFDLERNPAAARLSMEYMPDGLHPNDAGHRVLADLLEEFLTQLA